MLQAGLEGEPTWKTPRVPPAQSPGITPLAHEADSQASTFAVAPVSLDALLDAFVSNYVESIVSQAKSDLVAEALQATPLKGSTRAGAAVTPGSLAFTQGSSAGSTASPHKSRSASGPTKALPHKAQPRPMQVPLAQHTVSPERSQLQQSPAVAVCSSTQTARDSEVRVSPGGSSINQRDTQQEGQLGDALSSRSQAPAQPEVQGLIKDRRSSGSEGQQLTSRGVEETASASKQSGKDELLAPQTADADGDATRMVSVIVQEILQAVSESSQADQVSNADLIRVLQSEVCGHDGLDAYRCRPNTLHCLCCTYLGAERNLANPQQTAI